MIMPKISNIPIGTLGVLDIILPKVEIDSGKEGPMLVFTALQHGNEVTPLFVLQKLFRELKAKPLSRGKVVILPVTNPLGLVFETRREPLDGGNLNREAPGNPNKNLDKRIAAAVFEVCKNADLVVDLHTFSRQCPFVGILVSGDTAIEDRAKGALRAISPDCIWKIDLTRSEDKRYYGALDVVLTAMGIPAITLEMERHITIAEEKLDRVFNSLLSLLKFYRMYDGELTTQGMKEILVFVGTYLYFDQSGIFTPEKTVLQELQQGERLGTVFDLRTLEEASVRAPCSGTLLTVRFRDIVRTGSKLGSIGKQVDVL